MKGLKISALFLTGCLLGGCSPDGEVLYKDLEAKATHLILGFVFGDAEPQSKSDTPKETLKGHTIVSADTL